MNRKYLSLLEAADVWPVLNLTQHPVGMQTPNKPGRRRGQRLQSCAQGDEGANLFPVFPKVLASPQQHSPILASPPPASLLPFCLQGSPQGSKGFFSRVHLKIPSVPPLAQPGSGEEPGPG